ncbi:hypothetical protein MMC14_001085 [Varicellaria rhodocarpa]|nr:hypothetical protein [Varicellaria rhodocarpa]
MNPFRSRKKSQDDGESSRSRRPSADSEAPSIPRPSSRSRTFRRNKKKPEPKPEFDLASVLPSSDNFRTSLLLPNLSSRFSMLREQDDPRSMIGKANDDSVLFPKRASRLNLFNHDGLTDISEISSLPSLVRPPFAYERSHSYGSVDGYATDDDASPNGSVMGRARPGEGNKFFGGRQKIYKIPVGGSSLATRDGTRDNREDRPSRVARGRAVYDDDIALSAFQVLKQKEKEREAQESSGQESQSQSERTSRENERPRSNSPKVYNQKRETSSSTNSGGPNTRMSTAATSLASHSASSLQGTTNGNTGNLSAKSSVSNNSPLNLERTGTKSRRLYGQGLDQHIHEQQSSSMHRLDSIQRQRAHAAAPLPKTLPKSRSATNMNDRFQRSGPLYASNNFREFRDGSPPPSATPTGITGFDLGLDEPSSTTTQEDHSEFGRSPPLSPPMSPGLDNPTFLSSLEPNDIGKATASGAFNKPAQQYDDHQYAQRQLQLQEGRETPSPRAGSRNDSDWIGRKRNDSFASVQSSLGSFKFYNSQYPNNHVLNAVPETLTINRKPSVEATNRSFLGSLSSDESEAEPDLPSIKSSAYQSLSQAAYQASPKPAARYARDDQHPAFKNHNQDHPFIDLSEEQEHDNFRPGDISSSNQINATGSKAPNSVEQVDSPTLGPASTGLSGMIRAHLRQESNQSSIYPSPSLNDGYSMDIHRTDNNNDHTEDQHHQHTFHDQPWKNPQWNTSDATHPTSNDQTAIPAPLSLRAKQMLEQAHALKSGLPNSKAQQVLGPLTGADKAQAVLGEEAPRRSSESGNAEWPDHMRSNHMRGASTETQKEREDLANELADRRRRVQDNLKSFVDTGSRSASPMPGSRTQDASFVKAGGAFGLLKKASRGSIVGKYEKPSKAMQMLGIGPNLNSNGVTTLQESPVGEISEQSSQRMPLPSRLHTRPPPAPSNATNSSPQLETHREQVNGKDSRQGFTSRKQSPPSTVVTSRSRSNSTHQVSLSPNPNDHPSQMPRLDTRIMDYQPNQRPTFMLPRKHSPPSRPFIDARPAQEPVPRSQSAMSGRIRSNSKSAASGYFDQKALLPIQTSYAGNSLYNTRSPRASPNALQTSNSATSFHDVSPALSAASTPTMVPAGSFPSTTRVPAARKRSINKQDISEPHFMSCTSSVTTVDLPPGASLSNGMDDVSGGPPPPVPPINPRRKRTAGTQGLFHTFARPAMQAPTLEEKVQNTRGNKSDYSQYHVYQQSSQNPSQQHIPLQASVSNKESYSYQEETSTFSDEGDPPRPKSRHRLRKTESEGGNLAAKAKMQAMLGAKERERMPQRVEVGGPMF